VSQWSGFTIQLTPRQFGIWHRRFGNARLLNNIARRALSATENTLSSVERVSRRRVCLILMAVREMDRANSSGMLKFGDASITRLLSSEPGLLLLFLISASRL
jgi:hypothetical protein